MAFFDDDAQGKKVTYNQTAAPAIARTPVANPTNPYNLAYSAYGAPTQAQTDYQNQVLGQQLGLNNANYSTQLGYLNQQSTMQDQMNGLNQQSLASSGADLTRNAYRSGEDYDRAMRDYNLSLQDFYRRAPMYREQDALQQELFGLQGKQIGESATRQQQALSSNATARGALGSAGFGQGLGDINTQAQEARQNLTVQQQQFGLNAGERDAQLNTDAQRMKNQPGDIYQGYQRSVQDINSAIDKLNLQAKQMGISQADAKNRINQAISQLGISKLTNANDIILAMYNNDARAASQIPTDVLNAIRQLTGIPGV